MLWPELLFRKLLPPILLMLATGGLDIVSRFGLLPSSSEIFDFLAQAISELGPISIFILSIAEHTVVVNVYFPAAVVILVSMSETHGSISAALVVYSAIVTGQTVGYSTSYYVGRLLRSRSSDLPFSGSFIGGFFTFLHPHSGAVTCYLLGGKGLSPIRFAIFLCMVVPFWSVFWALLAYHGFVRLVEAVGWDKIFYSYLIAWIVYELYRYFAPSKESRPKTPPDCSA